MTLEEKYLQFSGKVIESLKNLSKNQDILYDKLDNLTSRMSRLESKLSALEVRTRYIWWLLAFLLSSIIGMFLIDIMKGLV